MSTLTPDKTKRKPGHVSPAKRKKKPRLTWIEGFELREQFPSSGDYQFIDSKMHRTIEPSLTGHQYSGYEIIQVFKVLNSDNYNRYRDRRQTMNLEIAKAKANGQSGAHVEEMHLWHGSPFAEKICQEGFSLGPARANGLFGKGVYFAEHSSKSNNYSWGVGGGCPAHKKQLCFDCTRMMLLCKVAIGRKMLTPEYVNCLPAGIDTIVAKPGVINAGLSYPEYIVYHQDQAYPSYLIKYKLQPPRPPKCAECTLSEKITKKDAAAYQDLPIKVAIPKSVSDSLQNAKDAKQCPIS